jgi:hypothetical protein
MTFAATMVPVRTWVDPALDRTDWGPGAWNGEPDKIVWTDEATGFVCMARRSFSGSWCGYVGVQPDHLLHGVSTPELDVDLRVHGGVTYAGGCEAGPIETAICHLTESGEPDSVWWIGFDCNHSGDYAPGVEMFRRRNGIRFGATELRYRTLNYVMSQCTALAQQLAAHKEARL